MSLADWGPISPDSALPGYTGPAAGTIVDQDDPTKYFTVQYYADQIARFQAVMVQLDQTAQISTNLLQNPDLDADSAAQLTAWLDDYNNKKTEFQLAAKTVNAVVSTVDAFGVGLPQVTLPQTLSLAPLAVAGVAAAVVAVAALIEWGVTYVAKAQAIVTAIQTLPPDQVQGALDAINASGGGGGLGSLASIVKWGAIAVAVWFGFQAFKEFR